MLIICSRQTGRMHSSSPVDRSVILMAENCFLGFNYSCAEAEPHRHISQLSPRIHKHTHAHAHTMCSREGVLLTSRISHRIEFIGSRRFSNMHFSRKMSGSTRHGNASHYFAYHNHKSKTRITCAQTTCNILYMLVWSFVFHLCPGHYIPSCVRARAFVCALALPSQTGGGTLGIGAFHVFVRSACARS